MRPQAVSAQARVTAQCPFCGVDLRKANRSREHVVPRWVARARAVADAYEVHPPSSNKRRTATSMNVSVIGGDIVLSPTDRHARAKVEHPTNLTVSVCRDCNTGWMAALESSIRAGLEPLIDGDDVVITSELAPRLVRWALKTSVAFQQDDPPSKRVVAAQTRDLLAARRPRWVNLFAARWSDQADVMLRHITRTALVSDGNGGVAAARDAGALTFLGFGHLALAVDLMPEYAPELQRQGAPPAPWVPVSMEGPTALPQVAVTRRQIEGIYSSEP